MLPARPDASVLQQAALATKALMPTIGTDDVDDEKVNDSIDGHGDAKEKVAKGEGTVHKSEDKSKPSGSPIDTDDKEEGHWLDYVIGGASVKQKRRGGDALPGQMRPTIDLSKPGLVKKSKNTRSESVNDNIGDAGRIWRRRIQQRRMQEDSTGAYAFSKG